MKLIREVNEPYQINGDEQAWKEMREFGDEDREHFIVLGLDTKLRVLYREVVGIGTLNSFEVHPREVFKKAVMSSANSIIIGHNHPSGDVEPSDADRKVYEVLKRCGKILDIQVIDALVFSKEKYYSFNGGDEQ
jgi:DNA repair protein RadC